MSEKPHRRLLVWQRAMSLVERIYAETRKFPALERYGLMLQMRRAAVSIPSNIAEGAARRTRKEYVQFLHTARGSLSELDTQLEIAVRLGYVASQVGKDIQTELAEISKMLSGLINSLSVI